MGTRSRVSRYPDGGNGYPIRYQRVPRGPGAGLPDPTGAGPGSASHRPPAQGQHHQTGRCGRAESHVSGPEDRQGRRFRWHRRAGLPGSRPGPRPLGQAAAIEGGRPAAGLRHPEAQPPRPPAGPPDRPGDHHQQGQQLGRRCSPANPSRSPPGPRPGPASDRERRAEPSGSVAAAGARVPDQVAATVPAAAGANQNERSAVTHGASQWRPGQLPREAAAEGAVDPITLRLIGTLRNRNPGLATPFGNRR